MSFRQKTHNKLLLIHLTRYDWTAFSNLVSSQVSFGINHKNNLDSKQSGKDSHCAKISGSPVSIYFLFEEKEY